MALEDIDDYVQAREMLLQSVEQNANTFNWLVGEIKTIYVYGDRSRPNIFHQTLRAALFDRLPSMTNNSQTLLSAARQLANSATIYFDRAKFEVLRWKSAHRFSPEYGLMDVESPSFDDIKKQFQQLQPLELLLTKLGSALRRYSFSMQELESFIPRPSEAVALCTGMRSQAVIIIQYIESSISGLIKSSIIVLQQPPCVVQAYSHRPKTDKISSGSSGAPRAFHIEVRLCFTRSYGTAIAAGSQLEAVLICDSDADAIDRNEKSAWDASWSLAKMQHHRSNLINIGDFRSPHLSAKFSFVRIISLETECRKTEGKTGMRHILIRTCSAPSDEFVAASAHSECSTIAEDHPSIWILSLPFSAVTNNTKQEDYRHALTLWQRAFFVNDRTALREELNRNKRFSTHQFFDNLNSWFKASAGTPRGLEEFREYIEEQCSPGRSEISYSLLRNETDFCFWSWFYPAVNYIFDFPEQWQNRLLWGFEEASKTRTLMLAKSAASNSASISITHDYPGQLLITHFKSTGPQVNQLGLKIDEIGNTKKGPNCLKDQISMRDELKHVTRVWKRPTADTLHSYGTIDELSRISRGRISTNQPTTSLVASQSLSTVAHASRYCSMDAATIPSAASNHPPQQQHHQQYDAIREPNVGLQHIHIVDPTYQQASSHWYSYTHGGAAAYTDVLQPPTLFTNYESSSSSAAMNTNPTFGNTGNYGQWDQGGASGQRPDTESMELQQPANHLNMSLLAQQELYHAPPPLPPVPEYQALNDQSLVVGTSTSSSVQLGTFDYIPSTAPKYPTSNVEDRTVNQQLGADWSSSLYATNRALANCDLTNCDTSMNFSSTRLEGPYGAQWNQSLAPTDATSFDYSQQVDAHASLYTPFAEQTANYPPIHVPQNVNISSSRQAMSPQVAQRTSVAPATANIQVGATGSDLDDIGEFLLEVGRSTTD